jgi:type 1 fimbria pilin
MTRKLFALGTILILAFALYAQGDKTVKLSGYLIDNACASAHVKDANFGERVKKHKTSCALMASCESSGYAVYADGKLYKFDENGNKSARDLLESTQTAAGVEVAVEGTLDGDTLKVSKLSEVAQKTN